MIERKLTSNIIKYINKFPSVAVLGPRQIGKTTLLKHIANILKKETLYIDLEKPSDSVLLEKNPESFFLTNKDKCIIIDEIQRMPSLFALLRPMIDEHRVPGRFILLGSASPTILKECSESLAGRIIYTELSGLNILELPKINNANINKLWLYGGFPEIYLRNNSDEIYNWHESFIRTYFERDIKLLGLNISYDILSRVFSMISHLQSSTLNISHLSKSIGIDRRTIEKILEYFAGSYIIRKLSPFYINVKKRLVKSPKYYIRDNGLYHHTLNIKSFNELLRNPYIGPSWEGFVIEQILTTVKRSIPYFYRTQAGAECDIVLVDGFKPSICIEAKASDVPKVTKGFVSSISDLNTEENYIIIPNCNNPYQIKENIMVCDLEYLLKKLEQKEI
ncbi:MAG: ATP-binding protein [Bacteroidetes bacterium]|nr:ATP-binding protein [Bacteroidota bacterium]